MTAKLSMAQERVLKLIERPKRMEDFRQFWSKKYGRELSMDETEGIQRNLSAYFKLLAKWSAEDKARSRDASVSFNVADSVPSTRTA